MVGRRREAGGLESEVLAALWAAGRPLTAGEVVDQLGTRLAYNTVATILSRLHAKGAVHRELAGRAHAYIPVLDQPALAANRMRAMLAQPGLVFTASMMRDIEQNARIEADHIIGDLIARAPASTMPTFSLAHIHLKAYEARRTREATT